jgi:L-amino acid N-acyltransferase YncA
VEIRAADAEDWPRIFPFYSAIVEAGETYAFPLGQSLEQARPWWMEQPPGITVVAVDGADVLGSAKMGPNRPGRGAHVATASFMVDPAHQAVASGKR